MIARVATFVLFQAGWTACVLGAASGRGGLGAGIGAACLAGCVALSPRPSRAALAAAIVAVAGPPLDLVQVRLGLVRLHEPLLAGFWIPAWLWMLWPLFAATILGAFRWLYGRYVLAAVLGALAGPMSYFAGSRLGAVDLHPDLWPSLLSIGLQWLVATPLLVLLAERLSRESAGAISAAAHEPSRRHPNEQGA